MSILIKYSLWLAALLLVVAGAITGAALWFQHRSMTEEALLRGQSIAVNLASPAGDALLNKNDLMLVGLALNATRDHKYVVYAAILNQQGRVKGHPDPKALGKPLGFSEERELPPLDAAQVREGRAGGKEVWDIRVPVRLKGTDKILGSVSVGIARESMQRSVRASLWRLAAISAVLLLLGVGLTAISVGLVVQPLRELSQASHRVGTGDFEVRVRQRGRDELGVLARNFNEMVSGLARAERARSEHMRIESELDLARNIQSSLLPAKPPHVEGLEIAFYCQPARELGGDFYDCMPIQGGKLWGFLIADVSGKGVPAALNMANLRNIFRLAAADCASPVDALKRVNALAFQDLKGENFVTMIYAVLNPKSGELSLVNAGHDPAFWFRGSGEIMALEATAMPLGLVEAGDFDREVKEHRLKMGRGDRLFTYTDGVTEAMDRQGGQFGLERLKEVVARCDTAAESVQRLSEAVALHSAGVEVSDDITMLALRWNG